MSRNNNKKEVDVTVMPERVTGTFFGNSWLSVPDEVRAVVPMLHQQECDAHTLRACLQQVVAYLRDNGIFAGAAGGDAYRKFQKAVSANSGGLGGDEVNSLFTGMYSVLVAAVASKAQVITVAEDLKRCHFPAAAVDDVSAVLTKSRAALEEAAVRGRIGFAQLDKLRWRVDVVISSGSLSRVMRPTLLMEMTLSNGRVRTFEVSVAQFNQLRFGAAKMLNDMQTLERHPVMRIEREEDAARHSTKPPRRTSMAAKS